MSKSYLSHEEEKNLIKCSKYAGVGAKHPVKWNIEKEVYITWNKKIKINASVNTDNFITIIQNASRSIQKCMIVYYKPRKLPWSPM